MQQLLPSLRLGVGLPFLTGVCLNPFLGRRSGLAMLTVILKGTLPLSMPDSGPKLK